MVFMFSVLPRLNRKLRNSITPSCRLCRFPYWKLRFVNYNATVFRNCLWNNQPDDQHLTSSRTIALDENVVDSLKLQ